MLNEKKIKRGRTQKNDAAALGPTGVMNECMCIIISEGGKAYNIHNA